MEKEMDEKQPERSGQPSQKNLFKLLDRWPVIPVVMAVFGVFVTLVIILGVFERGPLLLNYPSTLFILYSLLLAAAFAGLFWLVERATFLHKPFVFPVLVSGLAFVPRFIWIRLVETTPLWDFARYLNYARSIVAGDPGAIADIRGVFPHLTGYPLILSWVMRLFGTDVAVARWFNFFCTMVTLLLVYQLGKKAFSPRVGRGAAILFALWPGQVYYLTVVGGEHLFTMLMLGVLIFFVLSVEQEENVDKQEETGIIVKTSDLKETRNVEETKITEEKVALKKTGYSRIKPFLKPGGFALAAGVVLALAHIVRPVASLLFPAFFLYLLVKPLHTKYLESKPTNSKYIESNPTHPGQKEQHQEKNVLWKQGLLRRIPVLALILAGFLLTLNLLNAVYEPQVLVPLGKTGAGFNLYVGTNKVSRGMWNEGDWAIIEEYDHDFDRIHEEAWQRGMERIREDYRDFLLLAERKFSIQWSVSDYGFYWGMLELDRVTAVSLWAEEYRQELQVLSQVHYLSLMWLMLVGIWKTRKHRHASFNAFIAMLFFGFIAMHTLIEVQSRYHHSLVPLFILSAAYGATYFETFTGNILNTIKKRQENRPLASFGEEKS